MAFPKLSSTTSLSFIAVIVLAFGLVIAVVGTQQQQKTQSHAATPAIGALIKHGTIAGNSATGNISPITGLTIGATYKVVVSGVVNYDSDATDILVDAQWGGTTSNPKCFCQRYAEPKFNGAGLKAQDLKATYNTNHTYTYMWKAAKTSLQFGVTDSNYADNTGSWTFDIYLFALPIVVDTTAPTVPLGLAATPFSPTQINLAWTASTDAVGVTGYKVFRNGTLVTTVKTTTFQDIGLTPSTTYTYTVSAVDAAANNSAQSAPVTAVTPAAPDTTAPSVPTNLAAIGVSTSQINLAWTAATDSAGVTGYNVFRNGTKINTTAVTTPSFQDTGLTPTTTYSYTVSAFDAAGNESGKSASADATTLTPAPLDTILQLELLLHGVGKAGDSVNPGGGGGNFNLVHLQRSVRVEVINGNNEVIASNPNGLVLFDPQSGSFKGTVSLGTAIPTSGTYGIRVKLSQSLKALKLQTITIESTNQIAPITLINGDINDDNAVSINIGDYNTLLGCYSDFTPPTDCDPARKAKADLDDDGNVNFIDLNLFLRELNTVGGQ